MPFHKRHKGLEPRMLLLKLPLAFNLPPRITLLSPPQTPRALFPTTKSSILRGATKCLMQYLSSPKLSRRVASLASIQSLTLWTNVMPPGSKNGTSKLVAKAPALVQLVVRRPRQQQRQRMSNSSLSTKTGSNSAWACSRTMRHNTSRSCISYVLYSYFSALAHHPAEPGVSRMVVVRIVVPQRVLSHSLRLVSCSRRIASIERACRHGKRYLSPLARTQDGATR